MTDNGEFNDFTLPKPPFFKAGTSIAYTTLVGLNKLRWSLEAVFSEKIAEK